MMATGAIAADGVVGGETTVVATGAIGTDGTGVGLSGLVHPPNKATERNIRRFSCRTENEWLMRLCAGSDWCYVSS